MAGCALPHPLQTSAKMQIWRSRSSSAASSRPETWVQVGQGDGGTCSRAHGWAGAWAARRGAGVMSGGKAASAAGIQPAAGSRQLAPRQAAGRADAASSKPRRHGTRPQAAPPEAHQRQRLELVAAALRDHRRLLALVLHQLQQLAPPLQLVHDPAREGRADKSKVSAWQSVREALAARAAAPARALACWAMRRSRARCCTPAAARGNAPPPGVPTLPRALRHAAPRRGTRCSARAAHLACTLPAAR